RPGTNADWPAVPAAVAIVGGGLVLGALSYRYVERPFLRAARRPMHRARQGALLRLALFAVAAAVVGVALAGIPTTNPLADELHRRLGPSGYIDAKQNRYFSQAAPIIRDLRAHGALGRAVIIHLGNNGPVSHGDVDDVMRELNGVPNVLLVTVRVNASWQN